MRLEPGPLGILGGTFDPIHHAHLRLAEEARSALGLAEVRLIPAGQPPHRAQPGSAPSDRLAMTRLAVAGLPGFSVDAAEVLSNAPSYTVVTLERLRAELGPTRPLVLLMGADALRGLHTWFRWESLLDLAHIGVATRPGYTLEPASLPLPLADALRGRLCPDLAALGHSPAGLVCRFDMTPLDISATTIRQLLQRGESPRFLLPDGVLDYIQTHHLYGPETH